MGKSSGGGGRGGGGGGSGTVTIAALERRSRELLKEIRTLAGSTRFGGYKAPSTRSAIARRERDMNAMNAEIAARRARGGRGR